MSCRRSFILGLFRPAYLGSSLATFEKHHTSKDFSLGPVPNHVGYTIGILVKNEIAAMIEGGCRGSLGVFGMVLTVLLRHPPLLIDVVFVNPVIEVVQICCNLITCHRQELDQPKLKLSSLRICPLEGGKNLPQINDKNKTSANRLRQV